MKIRFSISNLLLLTAIVALSIGWYLDHKRLNKSVAIFDLMKISNNFSTGVAFAMDDDALYRVTYPRNSDGAHADAFRLSDGTPIWSMKLQAIGAQAHSAYMNLITIRLTAKGLEVFGEESNGAYEELIDVKTGKTLYNHVFRQ
jgi:hypothetical protein